MTCWDCDLVTYSIYDEINDAAYFFNDNLQEEALERLRDVSGWSFGKSLSHIPFLALDYLFDARTLYSYGFYRSCIFCCATTLDIELKRSLIEDHPNKSSQIEKQTFGQSIFYLERNIKNNYLIKSIISLKQINQIRNEVSVHPSRKESLLCSYMDESNAESIPTSDYITKFLNDSERKEAEEMRVKSGFDCFLRRLALKVFDDTREIIAS